MKALLPKVALPTLALIHISRILVMSDTQHARKAVVIGRYGNQMHVIRHQAICPNVNSGSLLIPVQQRQVFEIVLVAEKRGLFAITTLRYMVGISGNNQSCDSGHTRVSNCNIPIEFEFCICIT